MFFFPLKEKLGFIFLLLASRRLSPPTPNSKSKGIEFITVFL
jgi:hypothetical protein